MNARFFSHGSLLLAATFSTSLQAQTGDSHNDFGGIGLLQIPTARMANDSHFAFTANRVEPYSRYNMAWQVMPWAELAFRYSAVSNRKYGPASLSGDQSFKDKGVDLKIRFWEETFWTPELAAGLRDLGGTSLFGSEYLVASKHWGNLDFSLGLGWGYLSHRGDLANPLGLISQRFEQRDQASANVERSGEFRATDLFRGKEVSLFGGVEYQTPWEPLRLKLELDGNDYTQEPLGNRFASRYPVNIGASLQAHEGVDLHLGWERGDTLMAGITLRTDLANLRQTKFDPKPVPVEHTEPVPAQNWAQVAADLQDNAGLQVDSIARHDDTLVVKGESRYFRATPKEEGRTARILHQAAPDTIQAFEIQHTQRGMTVLSTTLPRQAFTEAARFDEPPAELEKGIQPAATGSQLPPGEPLYTAELDRYRYSLQPGLNQQVGGPDGFFLYQLYANLMGEVNFSQNTWLSGGLSANVVDNFDKFKYTAPSELPRVRTFIREYVTSTDIGVYNLQLNHTLQLNDEWYALGYAGLLELMFGGAGAEVLYRPLGSPLAFGVDANWVKQRDFDQRFDFRDYAVFTGHLTAYWDTGWQGVKSAVSAGQYLAGDKGATFAVSREFDSGVIVGAWATLTDAGDKYGEGSFDKGLYLSIPFDALFVKSSRQYTSLVWQPLSRDGGARLNRSTSLYQLTEQRDLNRYNIDRKERLE